MTDCDKCRIPVPPRNDASLLEAILTDPMVALVFPSRHLLPVVVGGEQICEGSPSRAQYLEGQPRDSRGDPYVPEREPAVRAAYVKLLEEDPEAG
jgi:hypothetical protein